MPSRAARHRQFRGWSDATDERIWCDSPRVLPPLARLRSHSSRTDTFVAFALARDGLRAAADVRRALASMNGGSVAGATSTAGGGVGSSWPLLHADSHVAREMRDRLAAANAAVAECVAECGAASDDTRGESTASGAAVAAISDRVLAEIAELVRGLGAAPTAAAEPSRADDTTSASWLPALAGLDAHGIGAREALQVLALARHQVRLGALNRSIERSM